MSLSATARTILLLVCIMAIVSASVASFAIYTLYQTAFDHQLGRLVETAQSRAAMIEAVARHDRNQALGEGKTAEVGANRTLTQILEAHSNFEGFGETGEYTLAKRIGDEIVFFLRHRHRQLQMTSFVPWGASLAEPMHRALKGLSGTLVGRDYRGQIVLAAYTPIVELSLGLVAKIDLVEIRAPFVRAGFVVLSIAMAAIVVGAFLFLRIGMPLVRTVETNEALLDGVLNGSNDIIFSKDANGQCLTVNDAGAAFFGMPKSGIIGRTNKDLFPEDKLQHESDGDQAVIEGGTPLRGEQIFKVDGRVRTFSTVKSPLKDVGGNVVGLVGVSRDITLEKKAFEKSERQRRQLAQAQAIACLGSWDIKHPSGVLSLSEQVYSIFGRFHGADEISMETYLGWVYPEDVSMVREALSPGQSQDAIVDIEHRIIRKTDGETRYVQQRCEHFFDETGQAVRSIGSIQDITDRVKFVKTIEESRRAELEASKMAKLGHFEMSFSSSKWSASEVLKDILGIDDSYEFDLNGWAALIHPDDKKVFAEGFERRDLAFDKEFRIVRRLDQLVIWVRGFGAVSFDENGAAKKLVGTIQDVSDQKIIQLRRSALLDISEKANELNDDDMFSLTLNWCERITSSSISFMHAINDDQETIALKAWSKRTLDKYCQVKEFDSHYPISQAGIWADSFRRKKPVVINDYPNAEGKKGLPDGHAKLDRLISMPIIEDGVVLSLFGVGNKVGVYDDNDVESLRIISDYLWRVLGRKRAEEIARESQALTGSIAESALDGIVLIDNESRIVFWNLAAQSIFGYSESEAIGKYVHDFLTPPEYQSDAKNGFANFQKTGSGPVVGQSVELSALTKSGERISIELSITAVKRQGQLQALGIVRDISDRKRAEDLLLESEKKYRTFFEQAAVGVALLKSQSGEFLEINDKFSEILGYSKREIQEMDFMQITHPDDLQEDLENMKKLLSGEIQEFSLEKRYLSKEGGIVWANLYVSSTADEGEVPETHIAIIDNISDRKTIEIALREQSDARQELDEIINRSPAVAFLWRNEDGWPVEYVSENLITWGYVPDDFYSGRIPFADIIYEDDLERVGQEVERFKQSGLDSFTQEYRIRTKSGKVRWIDDRTWVRRNEGGDITHFQGVVLDITEKKEAEQQLWQVQKAESLGNLAGGIAHDINNMLLPILSLSEMTMKDLPEGDRGRLRLSKVIEAGTRAKNLVMKILAFSHKEEEKTVEVDLVEVVSSVVELLNSTIPATIKIETKYPRNPLIVSTNPTEIHTLLVNLAGNSTDAIEGKNGNIWIELASIRAGGSLSSVAPHIKVGDSYAHIRFKDSGHGMPAHILERIFDPFFTTKDVGEGTGLGMALARSIVDKNHGAILAKSMVGKGTTFNLYFPLTSQEEKP